MKIPSLVLLVSTFLFAAGCATVSTQKIESAASEIRRGSTTKSDVITMLGEPDRKRIDPGGETWIYGDDGARNSGEVVVDQAIGIGAGFIPVPYIGTAISGVRSIGRSAQSDQPGASIKFDRAGKVRDYVVDIP